MTIRIGFLQELLCIRGTSVALYDYAHYNETILKNESIILLPEEGIDRSDPLGLVNFLSRFNVVTFPLRDLESILEREKVDLLYVIKYGKKDAYVSKKVKTAVHCVFDMSEPHGEIYAGVSKEVAEKYGKELYVPHMIGLVPERVGGLREKLGIPESAIVFGRYGGMDTFNLEFCWKTIEQILKYRQDIYFLFINTPQNVVHSRVIYLPKVVTPLEKNTFISACDTYLECGTMGHSFGLAIGEFSVNNKPIIAYREPDVKGKFWNKAHLAILGDMGLYYSDALEFYRILQSFKKEDWEGKDLNCYKAYSPENVMETFRKVFIE